MKKGNAALLLIIPIAVLILNLLFVKNQRKFFFNWTDPAYAYLFNGMNIANGKMEVGHIDHPGTTIQTANGIIIRLTYTFSGKEKDLSTDVLSNPEKYLHVISVIYILINCLLLFYVGYRVYNIRGPDNFGMASALLLQSGVLVFFNILATISNPAPETFLVWGVLLLTLICFSFIHESEISNRKMLKYALKFGLVCAFLAVTKVTSLPLLILPLFLLKKWKSWFLYVISFCFFTFIFLIPALSKIIFFIGWAEKLFFHSGIYGGGEEKIVDPAAFKQGLYFIFTGDIVFGIVLGLTFIALVGLIFFQRFRKMSLVEKWKTDASFRLLFGLFLSATFCVLIVAKHFSYHYLVPGYGLMMLAAFLLICFAFPRNGKVAMFFSKPAVALSAVLIFVAYHGIRDFTSYYFYEGYCNTKMATAKEMEKYKNLPHLYITYEFYSAEVSPALYFGLCYSGDMKYTYIPILNKLYPQVTFYSYPENKFHGWQDGELDWIDLVRKNKQMLVSFYYWSDDYVNNTFKVLNNVNGDKPVVEFNKVYANEKTGEQLFIMNRVGEVVLTHDSSRVITCDAELAEGTNLLSPDRKYQFQGVECLTDKYVHSGKHAVEVNATNLYGFGHHLLLTKGKQYEVTVWRKSDSGKGLVLASGPQFTVSSGTVIEEGADGWQKLSLKFKVPQTFTEPTITVFVWNENGDQKVYFDDMEIVEY